MKKGKKLLKIFLFVSVVIGLAACSDDNVQDNIDKTKSNI